MACISNVAPVFVVNVALDMKITRRKSQKTPTKARKTQKWRTVKSQNSAMMSLHSSNVSLILLSGWLNVSHRFRSSLWFCVVG